MRLRAIGAGVLLSVVVVASTAVAFAGGSAQGTQAGAAGSGLIAFTRPDGIYVTRSDGGGVRALRRGGVAREASGLAWSPDGARLAFVRATGNALWVMDADGSDLVELPVRAGKPLSPTWSPDGRMAFVAGRNIWVMDPDGTDQRRLVRTSRARDEYLRHPGEVDWSPVGNRLVVIGLYSYLPNGYVMSANGTDVHRISRHFDVIEPDWSPDGRRIAFTRWLNSGGSEEIHVMRADGSTRLRLTHNDVADREPSWSPDGRLIAFVRGSPSEASEIYAMNADGTGVTRLTHNQVAEASPAWQPIRQAP